MPRVLCRHNPAVSGTAWYQLIVGQLACLGKAIHALPDLNIHTVVVNEWGQVVLVDDGSR
jgi:hypothetical protein